MHRPCPRPIPLAFPVFLEGSWGRSGEELRSLLLIFLYLFVLFSLSLAREPGCRRQPQLGRSGTEWTADSAPIPWDMARTARTARTEAQEGFFSPLSGRKKTMIGQQPASRACWTMLNFPYLKDKPVISHTDSSHIQIQFPRLLERLLSACEQMQKGGWWLRLIGRMVAI